MESEISAVRETVFFKEKRIKSKVQRPTQHKLRTFSREQIRNKRILDLTITFLSLPVLIPLALLTALLIKLDSRGPVLFKQKRVGLLGKTFTMYKFRSMCMNSEENGCQFANQEDQRITKLGKFIRKYRIDEIPQFWNVLKGDMSVIGPRPEQVAFVHYFNQEIKDYNLRHFVKPGITGLAQVKHGYAACTKGTQVKLEYDLFYIKKHNLKLDLAIVTKTLKIIATGFGSR